MSRPTVFISSTILDFADLRSALHHWLEQMGCIVQMSELNDIERTSNQGTYESCFNAIRVSDYFILLIGVRRGSFYSDGVSVTQQEYRIASRLAREGKMRPIVFVREEVEHILRDQGLASTASTNYFQEGGEERISALEDPAFTRRFLEEVKSEEWPRADPDLGTERQWRYTFRHFNEIVQAIQVVLNLRHPLSRQIIMSSVEQEVLTNAHHWLTKFRNQVFATHWLLQSTYENRIMTVEDIDKDVLIGDTDGPRLALFGLTMVRLERLQIHALTRALHSGELLRYDPISSQLTITEIYKDVSLMVSIIERLLSTIKSHPDLPTSLFSLKHRQKSHVNKRFWITSGEFALLFSIRDSLENINRISASLWAYISGMTSEYEPAEILNRQFLQGEAGRLEDERLTDLDVVQWLTNDALSRNRLADENPT